MTEYGVYFSLFRIWFPNKPSLYIIVLFFHYKDNLKYDFPMCLGGNCIKPIILKMLKHIFVDFEAIQSVLFPVSRSFLSFLAAGRNVMMWRGEDFSYFTAADCAPPNTHRGFYFEISSQTLAWSCAFPWEGRLGCGLETACRSTLNLQRRK